MAGCGKCGKLVGHHSWCDVVKPTRQEKARERHDKKTEKHKNKNVYKGKGGR